MGPDLFAHQEGRVLGRQLLAVSRYRQVQARLAKASVSSQVVGRYVAGETSETALEIAHKLQAQGLLSSLTCLGEQVANVDQAQRMAGQYQQLLSQVAEQGLASYANVSVKLSALGQGLPEGQDLASTGLRAIAQAARYAGTAVTIDMEDGLRVDATLLQFLKLHADFPETAITLQANLHRTERDCQELTAAGMRVRLCKGAYPEAAEVAYQRGKDIDRSYARCLGILMAGSGVPLLATHDPVMIDLGQHLAKRYGRAERDYELQLMHGVRPAEQRRLAGLGQQVRVYLPFGRDWYEYLTRRLAEKPTNLGLFLLSRPHKR